MPLTGCVTTNVVCPQLLKPPMSVVDVLDSLSRKDPDAAHWTIELANHYDKLKVCKP